MDKRCCQCGEVKSEDGFYRSKRNSDGRDSYCKDCRDGRTRARFQRIRESRPKPKPVTEKSCTKCGEVKPIGEFYERKDRPGRISQCKACRDAYHAEYVKRPEVAERLKQQERNRAEGKWKRPPRREPVGLGFEVCTMCNLDKPLDAFHKHKLGRSGRDSVCKECRAHQSRERRKDPTYRELEHHWKVRRVFGLPDGGYETLLEAQGGGCAICGKTRGDRNGRRLHVDHDHATGTVRGLLCYGCNTGLGVFQDDPAILQAAIEYLRKVR